MTTNTDLHGAMLELLPCPFCSKPVPDDLSDTLYPSGIYWRDDSDIGRHYITHSNEIERAEDDNKCWEMNCTQNMGGCGASIHADSREEVIAKWNRRAATQQAAIPEGLVPCPNCDGAGSVMVPSDNGPDAYDMEVACPHCDGKQTLPDAYLGVVKLLKAERASHQKTYSIIWGHYGTVQSEALQRQIKRIAAQIKPENLDWLRDRLNDLAASAEGYLAASPAPPKQQPALGRGEVGGVPLSDEQIDALWDKPLTMPQKLQRRFITRRVEAAHGIGKAPTGQINPDSAGQGME